MKVLISSCVLGNPVRWNGVNKKSDFIQDWEQDNDNTWTVPIGFGINKTFQFGDVPVRIGLEYHHTVIEPDDIAATDWSVRFYIIPAVPSALFDWMQ